MRKRNMLSSNKFTALFLAICFVLFSTFLSGCEGKESNTEAADIKYSKVSDFTGATVCSQTGTMFDRILNGSIKKLNHKYHDDISGMILALRNKDVDAISLDEPVARLLRHKTRTLKFLRM